MPLSQDELIAQFKSQGVFDDLRRTLFQNFNDDRINKELGAAIVKLVQDEAAKSPAVLSRDPSKSVALIEGSLGRQTRGPFRDLARFIDAQTLDSPDVYKRVERVVRETYKRSANS